jgi:hypothetical protein
MATRLPLARLATQRTPAIPVEGTSLLSNLTKSRSVTRRTRVLLGSEIVPRGSRMVPTSKLGDSHSAPEPESGRW